MTGDRQSLLELARQSLQCLYNQHNGETLLHIASKYGHLKVVKTLIEVFGFQLNIIDELGNSPSHSACAAGQIDIMDYYDKSPQQINVYQTNQFGNSILHSACESGIVPMVRWVFVLLLREQFKFEGHIKMSEYRDEVFSEVVSEISVKQACKLDHNIFFIKNNLGYTPLHYACSLGHADVVKFYFYEVCNFFEEDLSEYLPSVIFLSYGTNIVECFPSSIYKKYVYSASCITCEIQDVKPRSANIYNKQNSSQVVLEPLLFHAARCGDVDFLKDYIGSAPQEHLQNEQRDTLLHAACISGSISLAKFVHKRLFQDITNNQNGMGNTCLHLACEWGSPELVKYLLEEGFKVNVQNLLGQTPLHLSILHERKEIFDILLEANEINVYLKNNFGETPLHIAAAKETCYEYVESLSEYYKEDCNVKDCCDDKGETPLFNACRSGNEKILNYFISNKKKWDFLAINKRKETIAYTASRLRNLDLLDTVLSEQHYPKQNLNILNQTLLQVASMLPDLDVVRHLLNNMETYTYKISDEINLIDHHSGLTLIQNAYKKRNKKLFDFLLSVPNRNIDVRNNNGKNTLLHMICLDYDEEFAKPCIKRCKKMIQNSDGDTPLHLAAKEKKKVLLKELLNDLPSLCQLDNYYNKSGLNLLHLVASMDDMLDIIKLIVSKQIINPLSKNPKTNDSPLHYACRNGIKENACYLMKYYDSTDLIYNNDGKSPLYCAFEQGKLDFLEEFVLECSMSLLSFGFNFDESPDCILFKKNTSVAIPFSLYMILHCFFLNHGRQVQIDKVIYNAAKRITSLPELTDSHNNTLCHYLGLVSAALVDVVSLAFSDSSTIINSLNDDMSSPLHIACYCRNESIIWKLLNHSRGCVSINKQSIHGLPLDIYQRHLSNTQDMCHTTSFFIAHGAKSSLYKPKLGVFNKEKNVVIRLYALGNSGVGKTSLFEAIKSKLNVNFNQTNHASPQPTVGLEKSMVKCEDCIYDFNDFAGQPEYEISHSPSFQSDLSSSFYPSPCNAFVLFVVVKGTEDDETNKKQIDSWMNFICSHKIDSNKSVRVVLVCSHADHMNQSEIEKYTHGLKEHFLIYSKKLQFLKFHDVCICLNCQFIDATPLDTLLNCIDKWAIPLQNHKKLSNTAIGMELFLNDNFKEQPVKVKSLIKKLKACQIFELNNNGIIYCGRNSVIISQVQQQVVECLEELKHHNSILLLKCSDDNLNWWVVGKDKEDVFYKHAASLTVQGIIGYSKIKNTTGVVPISELYQIFNTWGIKDAEYEVLIDYLLFYEFCKEIPTDTVQMMDLTSNELENDLRHFFFPGMINRVKDESLYVEDDKAKYFSGWSMKTRSRLNLKFRHNLLLQLPFKFTAMRENSHVYDRHISVWTSGMHWDTEEEIEVLIEFKDDEVLIVLCRSYSSDGDTAPYLLARHRSRILQEIKKIWNDFVQKSTEEIPEAEEYVLYPSPDYLSVGECSRIEVRTILESLKSEATKRSIRLPCSKSSSKCIHFREMLGFDPYIELGTSFLKELLCKPGLAHQPWHFPCKVATFLEKMELHLDKESPPNEINLIFENFSIFNAKYLDKLFS